jgi:hypothetical protein
MPALMRKPAMIAGDKRDGDGIITRHLHSLLRLSRGIQISPVMGIENSPPGSRFGLFGTNEAGLQLLLEPIRIAANVECHRVMQ